MDPTCACQQLEVLYWKKGEVEMRPLMLLAILMGIGDQNWRSTTTAIEKESAAFLADKEDFDVCIV